MKRGGGRPESRILYWYRTPPGVRVGRPPLDEEAIRLLEASNPQVRFDWSRMLKSPPGPPGQDGRTAPPPKRRDRRGEAPPGRRAAGGKREFAPRGETPPAQVAPVERAPALDEEPQRQRAPSTVEVIEEPVDPAVEAHAADRPLSAAEARLGTAGLARLRARYAELMARITERGGEPEAVEELRNQAGRLNPDAWITDEEVREALEQYESIFDSIRGRVGPPARRRRRRSGPSTPV